MVHGNDAVAEMVARGLGGAIVPELAADTLQASVLTVSFRGLVRPIDVVLPPHGLKVPAVRALLRVVNERSRQGVAALRARRGDRSAYAQLGWDDRRARRRGSRGGLVPATGASREEAWQVVDFTERSRCRPPANRKVPPRA